MAELLTVFNEVEKSIGVKEREDVHRDGDWHDTFHCWLFLKEDETIDLLFQQRSCDKKDFPGLYDITAAGHIGVGEDWIDAGLREIEEEIGVKLNEKDLSSIGRYKEQLLQGELVDREICRLYLYPCFSLPTFSIGEEVQDVVRISLKEINFLIEGKKASVVATSVLNGREKTLAKEVFVPHEHGYMQYVLNSIQCYVAKL